MENRRRPQGAILGPATSFGREPFEDRYSKVRLQRTIGRRITLTKASPEALVKGYGKALADILAELVPALRTAA